MAVGDVVTVGETVGDAGTSGTTETRTHTGPAGIEAEVLAINRTEATVMPLAVADSTALSESWVRLGGLAGLLGAEITGGMGSDGFASDGRAA